MTAARTLALGLALLGSLAVPITATTAPAMAQGPRDYALDAERWNGLGYLLTTASEARVEVQTPSALDLAALGPEDIVLLVYPTRELPIADLLAFVESGGYLIVADDHGSSPPLLEALGISRRRDGPQRHAVLWEEQDGFLLVRPAGEHFLFFNVSELVTNHPAAFHFAPNGVATHRASLSPVLSFEGGREHLVVEANHGRGKLIAVADPSMLINEMLRRFYGNKQFAANLLRYPCLREPCRATIILPDSPLEGRFDRDKARLGSLPRDVEQAIATVNDAIAELSLAASRAPWSSVTLGLILALLGALSYVAILRARRRDTPLLGPTAVTGSSATLDEVRGLVAQRHDGDFAALAAPLAQAGLDLARRHRLHDHARLPDEPRQEADSAQRDALRAALIRIESEAVAFRSREPALWSAERFLRLWADVSLLRETIQARRIRSPHGARS